MKEGRGGGGGKKKKRGEVRSLLSSTEFVLPSIGAAEVNATSAILTVANLRAGKYGGRGKKGEEKKKSKKRKREKMGGGEKIVDLAAHSKSAVAKGPDIVSTRRLSYADERVFKNEKENERGRAEKKEKKGGRKGEIRLNYSKLSSSRHNFSTSRNLPADAEGGVEGKEEEKEEKGGKKEERAILFPVHFLLLICTLIPILHRRGNRNKIKTREKRGEGGRGKRKSVM